MIKIFFFILLGISLQHEKIDTSCTIEFLDEDKKEIEL